MNSFHCHNLAEYRVPLLPRKESVGLIYMYCMSVSCIATKLMARVNFSSMARNQCAAKTWVHKKLTSGNY